MAIAVQFSTRPLYLQVRDALADRIVRGEWQAGAMLPNEVELSRQLQVSQGTVRKALGELEMDQLVTRRQGRGTFVNDLTQTETLRRFGHLRGPDNRPAACEVSHHHMRAEAASEVERARLGLDLPCRVLRIRRIRSAGRRPFLLEDIVMPAARFPGLERQSDPPVKLSALAQQFGLLLGGAEEKITIAKADHDAADALAVPPGAALLRLDRLVHLIDGRPIQWRVAHCHLMDRHYFVQTGDSGRKRKHEAASLARMP
ncbi:MAG TPA: GntR family transcriptional regulator [Hyphomicrobiaceae bacterium]|nr:GntR family transcriptional regulator [Hyphomicrobiaceae bacterium]